MARLILTSADLKIGSGYVDPKRMRRTRTLPQGDDGFTLIELLVVMVIIGVLASIAIPVFLSQRARARDAATVSDVSKVGKELATYYVDGTGRTYACWQAGSGGRPTWNYWTASG